MDAVNKPHYVQVQEVESDDSVVNAPVRERGAEYLIFPRYDRPVALKTKNKGIHSCW